MIFDKYRLLDPWRPNLHPARLQQWADRQIADALENRTLWNAVITDAEALDPDDTSPEAQRTREVAGSATDHRDARDERVAWVIEALATDPALADRIDAGLVTEARHATASQATAQHHDADQPHDADQHYDAAEADTTARGDDAAQDDGEAFREVTDDMASEADYAAADDDVCEL